MRPGPGAPVFAALVSLAGCATHVDHVAMDPARLVQPAAVQLGCAYRLQSIEDARPAGDRAGGLGAHMFVFEDAVGAVGRQLAASGLREGGQGAPVTVRILQLYLTQNTITKVPVVVYEVSADAQPPFLVRAQTASMNWNGTQNEAYAAYARALQSASDQLVTRLNGRCMPPRPA